MFGAWAVERGVVVGTGGVGAHGSIHEAFSGLKLIVFVSAATSLRIHAYGEVSILLLPV